jgi:hypothetical protein
MDLRLFRQCTAGASQPQARFIRLVSICRPGSRKLHLRRSALPELPPDHFVGGAAEPSVSPLAPSFGSSLPFAIYFLLQFPFSPPVPPNL